MPSATQPRRPRARPLALARVLVAAGLLAACSDADQREPYDVEIVRGLPATAPAATPLEIEVEVRDGGVPQPGVELELAVSLGGGSVEPARVRTDDAGRAALTWTIGLAPVANQIAIRAPGSTDFFRTRATLAEPYAPAPFGDVNAFLAGLGIAGSTEDLAFTPDGERLLLGVPGGLLALDPQGNATQVALSGEPLDNPLGIAFDRKGFLWVADSGRRALMRVSPDGAVTTALADDGTQPLVGPNYVAIGHDDRVYLSDPCLGELIRFDPERGVVDAVLAFDLITEGGPNGFAFDLTGERLWLVTENTGLLCGHPFVPITDPIASLFAIDVGDAGFGARETIASNFALFGDGVAFDAENNLYAIFDTQRDFMLEESAIWVLPSGSAQLEKVASVRGRVLANLAFGTPAFGEGELYIALLAVPPFTPVSARGAERLTLGIPGLPLLP
jgi:sugar lactone lactonase YvrE